MAWWLGNAAQDQLSVSAYLGEVRAVADAQASRADTFSQLLIDTSGLQVQRAGFTATIDQIVAGNRRDIETLAALEAPSATFATDLFLALALERWTAGLMAFSEAATRLPDRADLAARSDLADASTRIQIADGLYAEFQLETARLLGDADGPGVAPFPDARYLDASFATPEGQAQLISAILSNPGMASTQDLSIVSIDFTPSPVGTPGSTPVQLPATDTVTVAVVIRNDGTDREAGLEVRLDIRASTGTMIVTDPISVTQLGASGESTNVAWADLPVEQGRYTVTVALVRAGGGTIDTESTDFVVNPPSG